jgi:hypothetical protein
LTTGSASGAGLQLSSLAATHPSLPSGTLTANQSPAALRPLAVTLCSLRRIVTAGKFVLGPFRTLIAEALFTVHCVACAAGGAVAGAAVVSTVDVAAASPVALVSVASDVSDAAVDVSVSSSMATIVGVVVFAGPIEIVGRHAATNAAVAHKIRITRRLRANAAMLICTSFKGHAGRRLSGAVISSAIEICCHGSTPCAGSANRGLISAGLHVDRIVFPGAI